MFYKQWQRKWRVNDLHTVVPKGCDVHVLQVKTA
jgi:hypothetical protein